MPLQVNSMKFYSLNVGISLPHSLIVEIHLKLLVTVRDKLQTSTGTQGPFPCTRDSTHCSGDKHLARPDKNEKEMEGNYLPSMPGLLTKK